MDKITAQDISRLKLLTKDLTLLYVEDNKSFAYDTVSTFEIFFKTIDLALNGEEALFKYLQYFELHQKYYDIVITDISMPKLNGLELTRSIYTYNDTQLVVVISAHNNAQYLLEFLNLGIEYFLVKPFNLKEIVDVIHNCSKKLSLLKSKENSDIISLANNFTWNTATSSLYYKENYIKLTKKEIQLLDLLVQNKNNILELDIILHTLWDDIEHTGTVYMLNPIISRLKKKLPEELIQSIYGLGYKLISPPPENKGYR